MTQAKKEISNREALIAFVVLVAFFGGGGYYLFRLTHPARVSQPAPTTPSMHSALLNMDIPNAEPLADAGNITEQVLNTARALNLACTTSQEFFALPDEVSSLAAINQKMQAENYDRVTLYSGESGIIFKTTMPKPLLGMIAKGALFLCEY